LNIDKNLLNRIEIINAEDVITNEDKPVKAVRRKKDSSLVKGMNALKDGYGDAIVSAGNTGALLSGGLFIVGRLPGIERPCLAPLFPNGDRFSLLMDAGANVDCKPSFLNQFALMGSIYMENVLKIESPRVGLINIGTEEGKGNKLVNDAFRLLRASELNFIGNVEARDILANDADILVCDGFVGNVVLKLMEGIVSELMGRMKNEIMKTTKGKIGGYLIKDSMKMLKDQLDYSEHGGAPLLGLKAPVIKAHGSSDSIAIIIKEELEKGGEEN